MFEGVGVTSSCFVTLVFLFLKYSALNCLSSYFKNFPQISFVGSISFLSQISLNTTSIFLSFKTKLSMYSFFIFCPGSNQFIILKYHWCFFLEFLGSTNLFNSAFRERPLKRLMTIGTNKAIVITPLVIPIIDSTDIDDVIRFWGSLVLRIYTFSVRCPYESPARTRSSSGAGSGFSPMDYGSPPAAAAAVHLHSASMVPDFSPVLELTK